MNQAEPVAESSSDVQTEDSQPDDLQPDDLRAVDELSVAYARVLDSVWSMKRFDRLNPTYAAFDSSLDTKLVKRLGWPGLILWPLRLPFFLVRGWRRSFVLRPVVSLTTETHINSSASKLSSKLIRQRLRKGSEDGTELESLDRSIASLERLRSTTTGWVTLMVLLKFVPLIGLLFSMGIITVSFTLKDAPGLLLRLTALVPITVLLLHPLAVQFGFRWKRALFGGGYTATSGNGSALDVAGLPTENTYEVERRAFQRLGIKRSTEFPVDLFMAPGFYFLLEPIIGFIFGTVEVSQESDTAAEVAAGNVVMGIFIVFFAMAAVRLGLRYRLRRASRRC